ncbi:MAG TPA: hypothetical protein VN419_00830 [Humidesulfovibrio sp.]|uniref:hypothetical protein n=1 Tax=Humidesulfovibrio sp. TaxID=2910988 RepID=UPI002D189B01|nr:hypothetical protein [Humidesulfovibrio sp.]HWR02533.1 hypothetical protein [Humidesulfovibrio sp.]
MTPTPTTPFAILDSLLIAPFRLLPQPEAAFLFGVVVLALAGAALGRAGYALVARAQRARWTTQDAETKRRQELSIQAAQAGNKAAYLAQNHLAQEAYGNTMALSAGRAAALLWPACALLAWLYWRFEDVPMPLLWEGAGPGYYFLPVYAAILWIHSRLARAKKAAPPANTGSAA